MKIASTSLLQLSDKASELGIGMSYVSSMAANLVVLFFSLFVGDSLSLELWQNKMWFKSLKCRHFRHKMFKL